jgi:two-component system CheB/CheR fusion protein
LLQHVQRARGFDFSGYKTASLERRIKKRLDALGLDDYAAYQDHLEANPAEFRELFDTILINVTGFFRDREAWEYVASELVPILIARAADEQPIRVWSAACASGEEAYTVAMVLAEALGEQEFRRRVKIYATDIDEEALLTARQGQYPREALDPVPEDLREKYWTQSPSGYVFRPDLRRSLIFGRNDLVRDAPISRIDLLLSRNSLMYFTTETQAAILRHFNFSLNDDGFLFLGKSEMLLTHNTLFKPYAMKWRVFTKVPRLGLRDRFSFLAGPTAADELSETYQHLREGAADRAPTAQVVLDANGFLVFANRSARNLFNLAASDLGRPIQDLEISYRPIELREPLAQARTQGAAVSLGPVRWTTAAGDHHDFAVELLPLHNSGPEILGVSVTFTDVTEIVRLTRESEDARHQLETAYEELQSTVEELETTNEELQSTNEELETTNEELQSTNEELETMNEELQSTNDELEAMNDVQRERADEVERLNSFIEGILATLGVAVVVLDDEQTVKVWNALSTDLWGLRADEVDGKPFFALDMGLPLDRIRGPVRAALSENRQETVSVEAVDRRGRGFTCTVRSLPLHTDGSSSYGVVLLMWREQSEMSNIHDGDAQPRV